MNVHPVSTNGNGRGQFALDDSLDSAECHAGKVGTLVVELRVADAIPTRDRNVSWRRHLHAEGSVEDVTHDQGIGPKPVEGNQPVIGLGLAHSNRPRCDLSDREWSRCRDSA